MKKIVRKNGRLFIDIDGKQVLPIAYTSYLPTLASFDKFRDIGYKLFSVCLYMGDMPINGFSGIKQLDDSIWKSRNEYDFSIVDKNLSIAIENSDAYVLLRINVNAPSWWLKENPDECTVMENGITPYQSVFSQKWITDVKVFLEKLKEYIAKSKYADRVIGWQIAAMNTEEWLAPSWKGSESDFSLIAHDYFKNWCKNKYKTLSTLNDTWNTNYLYFDEILVPKAKERTKRDIEPIVDLSKHAKINDWYTCLNERYATASYDLTKFTKQLFDGDILVGCFYGYITTGAMWIGHTGFELLLNSPYIDFFASPFPYVDGRKSPTDWFYQSGMNSCANAGKLWFLEADIRTHKTKLLCEVDTKYVDKGNEYMEMPTWYGPKDEEQSFWHLTKAFSKVLCSSNAFWWFDMWGGWYDTPSLQNLLFRMRNEYEKEMSLPYNNDCEIAVVIDSQSSYAISYSQFSKVVFTQMCEVGFVGAPYDLYLKSMVNSKDLSRYKLVIYVAPYELSAYDIDLLNTLSSSGNTVLITGRKYVVNGENLINTYDCVNATDLKSYCEMAGVHLYANTKAVIYKSEHHICITAPKDSDYELSFKRDCVLTSFISGKKIKTENKKITITLKEQQSELFIID